MSKQLHRHDATLRSETGGFAMLIGCPKEVKAQEYRVGLTPAAAQEAVA